MAKVVSEEISDLMTFLNDSPTAWHAVANAVQLLLDKGFQELKEGETWKLQSKGKYFVVRNGSSLCAFIVPKKLPSYARIAASHTDSPSFKLKPNAEFRKENMVMLGLEVYGAPLLTSWLNRDLGIAGRVVYKGKDGKIGESLVKLEDHPVVIPQLAIHLDRNVNENGLVLNKQDHLAALAALDYTAKASYLESILKAQVNLKEVLGNDLYLYPLERSALLGQNQEMIAAYRIDSLGSVHAILRSILQAKQVHDHQLNMAVFWDNEEIGSSTAQGAGSPFFPQILERILLALGLGREDYFKLVSKSLCVSVDLAHALHPNYPEKHDPRHQILLNKGIVIKTNAQQRYASDARTLGLIVELCERHNIRYNKFASRGDIPCGSTIGPIHAGLTGMSTVDIGCAQLSMHSCRELAGCRDQEEMCKLIRVLYS